MTDSDDRRRFNLSEGQPRKAFTLKADMGPPIRDKDNVHPVIPPPRVVFSPDPRLAPPGMMGSRLAKDAAKWMEEKRKNEPEERRFKPFNHEPGRSRWRDR